MQPNAFLVVRPTDISESKRIASSLREGGPVLLDSSELSNEDRYRMYDYLRGAAFVLDMTVRQINRNQLLFLAEDQDGGELELED